MIKQEQRAGRGVFIQLVTLAATSYDVTVSCAQPQWVLLRA